MVVMVMGMAKEIKISAVGKEEKDELLKMARERYGIVASDEWERIHLHDVMRQVKWEDEIVEKMREAVRKLRRGESDEPYDPEDMRAAAMILEKMIEYGVILHEHVLSSCVFLGVGCDSTEVSFTEVVAGDYDTATGEKIKKDWFDFDYELKCAKCGMEEYSISFRGRIGDVRMVETANASIPSVSRYDSEDFLEWFHDYYREHEDEIDFVIVGEILHGIWEEIIEEV